MQYFLLRELCSCELGGTPSRKREDYWNGDIHWINSGEYTNIANNCFENEKLIELRDSLLLKLMSGELDVSDLNI